MNSSIIFRTCLALVLLGPGPSFLSNCHADGAAAYLGSPLHPPLASIAGAGVAWREQLTGLQWNPAILDCTDSSGAAVLASYSLLTEDRKYGGADLVMALEPSLVFGLTVANHSIENIDAEMSTALEAGRFAYRENFAAITFAGRLHRPVSLGIRFRYLFENMLEKRADGIGFDVGGTWEPYEYLRIGASMQNLLSHLWWSTGTTDEVLMVGRAGVAGILLNGDVQVEMDVAKSIGEPWDASVGGQYSFRELLFVRAGIATSIDTYGGDVRMPDYGLGVGMRFSGYGVDYALVLPSSGGGLIHKAGIAAMIPVR